MSKMVIDGISFEAALASPQDVTPPGPWAGHIPFAHWLIAALKPKILVELGTFKGNSYLNFCQSIIENSTSTKAFAIDTWQGDEHCGYYGEEVLSELTSIHNPKYGNISTLIRSTFEQAVNNFDDKSIDVLHIDGLHTYDAVRKDFFTWLPKLSDKAVVLFHDTNVYESGFGVYKFWGEISQTYPSFNFLHSNGLGVLVVGENCPDVILKIATRSSESHLRDDVLKLFAYLGSAIERRVELEITQHELLHANKLFDAANMTITDQDLRISELKLAVADRDKQIFDILNDLHEQRKLHLKAARQFKYANSALSDIQHSNSWKLTAPLRATRRQIENLALGKFTSIGQGISLLTRIRNALRYIGRGDLSGLLARLKFYRQQKVLNDVHIRLAARTGHVWGILTTPHTLFIARTIAERLTKHGIESEVVLVPPKTFDHDFYIVLCAQMFKELPPPDRRIVFQLEQSVSSRWFTPEYIDMLRKSLAVLEYSLTNIEFLAENGITYPQVIYLPIGASLALPDSPSSSTKEYDFIFYGDSLSSPRRRKLLNALQKKFTVKICNNVFGDEMIQLIQKARAIINIHYYENALLETPRIHECISLGVPILSESTDDQNEYPELIGAVRFFNQGSEEDMLEAAANMLEDLSSTSGQLERAAETSAHRFTFMFDRFLVALGVLPATAIVASPIYLEKNSNFVGLSLPETIKRRKVFMENKPENCVVFDGVRNSRGWVGCGSSFSAMARNALAHNIEKLTIIEDDALLPEQFHENIKIVEEYLERRDMRWDIFSGMMASVHQNAQVFSVEKWKGLTFVTINRMTSTVCNIYNKSALEILAQWNPMDLNVDKNTIDRYLERQADLRVVVALPFIAGHREEVESTLWGFENDQYAPMIAEAETRIKELADDFILKCAALND